MYDDDEDSGDISLSFPISRSSPQLSSILDDTDKTPGPSRQYHPSPLSGGSARTTDTIDGLPLPGDISTPTPSRLQHSYIPGSVIDSRRNEQQRLSPSKDKGRAGQQTISGSTRPSVSMKAGSATENVIALNSPAISRPPSQPKWSRPGSGEVRSDSRGSISALGDGDTLNTEDPIDRGEDVDTPLGSVSFWGSETARPSSVDPSSSSSSQSKQSRPMTRRTSSNTTISRSRSLNLHVRLPSYDLSTTSDERGASSSAGKGGRTNGNGPMSAVEEGPSSRLGWSRTPGGPRPPPLVDDRTAARMERWIKEIVVCNFDLERGPVVERRVMGRRWGPGEKENVAFSSFPDTSLFAEGTIVFSFKIRHIPPDPSTLHHPEPPSPMPDRVSEPTFSSSRSSPTPRAGNGSSTPSDRRPSPQPDSTSGSATPFLSSGEKAEEYRKWDERGREWLYGYVWFEQRHDTSIARGYMQKSLVILTHLPFPSLFSDILHRISPAFFQHGYSALESACNSIASWPDPRPDSALELPLMSEILNVRLPDMHHTPQLGHAFNIPSPQNPLLVSLPPSTPLRTFAPFLASLWSLWECLVLAEPVLIIAPDPKSCSEIVWWLRDLFRPIPPAGDFRPYLHIHDHDFSLLVNASKPQPGLVVGVTNPFFRKAASHWPNVISIAGAKPVKFSKAPSSTPSISQKDETPQGFLSRRHRSVSKDRVLLKRLEALVAAGNLDDPAGNEALRTHFQQLTERMLVPLNRYFQTLVPNLNPSPNPSPLLPPSGSQSSISSQSTSNTALKPFSLPAFLSHLRTHGPNPLSFRNRGLTSKSRVESDFYASFCMSATFARWLASKIESLGDRITSNTPQISASSSVNNSLNVPSSHVAPTKANPALPASRTALSLGSLSSLSIASEIGSESGHLRTDSTKGESGDDGAFSISDDASTASADWRRSDDSRR